MIYRASVADLTSHRLTREAAYVVVVMRFYPRGVPRALLDEYVRDCAPEAALFAEFKDLERRLGDHDRAFAEVRYEERFWLTKAGMTALRRLSGLARVRPLALVCQCRHDQRCHADLLLMMAARLAGAPVATPAIAYPIFHRRLEDWAADL